MSTKVINKVISTLNIINSQCVTLLRITVHITVLSALVLIIFFIQLDTTDQNFTNVTLSGVQHFFSSYLVILISIIFSVYSLGILFGYERIIERETVYGLLPSSGDTYKGTGDVS